MVRKTKWYTHAFLHEVLGALVQVLRRLVPHCRMVRQHEQTLFRREHDAFRDQRRVFTAQRIRPLKGDVLLPGVHLGGRGEKQRTRYIPSLPQSIDNNLPVSAPPCSASGERRADSGSGPW